MYFITYSVMYFRFLLMIMAYKQCKLAALTMEPILKKSDCMAPQIITDCKNFTLDLKQLGLCAFTFFFRFWDLDFTEFNVYFCL